jgi:hypothetical protein
MKSPIKSIQPRFPLLAGAECFLGGISQRFLATKLGKAYNKSKIIELHNCILKTAVRERIRFSCQLQPTAFQIAEGAMGKYCFETLRQKDRTDR